MYLVRSLAFLMLAASSAVIAADDLVLVAGATGRTGSLVVAALVRDGMPVRAMTRSADQAAAFGDGIEGVVADVTDPPTLVGAVRGAGVVISTIGASTPVGDNGFAAVDWEGNRALIDAAREAGVRHFLLMTAGSAGRKGGRYELPTSPYPWKARAEQHLRDSGLDYTILAPGGLRDSAAGEKAVVLVPREDYESGQISRADVAEVLVACIDKDDCLGKTITIVNGDETATGAWRERLAELPADR